MKKVLFITALFFVGLFGGNAQSYWNTNGNSPCFIEYTIGTTASSFCAPYDADFNIIHANETMTRFEKDLVILAPNASTKVLIGDPQTVTTPGSYKLYVEEGIMTERVKVALSGSPDWADYVFKDGYELMPLAEVELFISKYGHLPNIPSAKELVKEGLDLGNMQAKQMAKIEELTLHLIQKDKEVKALQKQVEMLSKKVELLLKKQQI